MGLRWMGSAVLVLGVACDSSIAPEPEEATDAAAPVEIVVGPVTTGEVIERTLDASDMEQWAYVDLDENALVMPKDPASASDWDLSFKRFTIAMNGGVTGAGGVEVAVLKGVSFDEVTDVPSSGFASDGADGSDDDEETDYVMSTGETGWYDYDPTKHALIPREHVYVVQTTERAVFKLEIVDYYNEAGTSGHVALRFSQLQANDIEAEGE